MKRIEPSAEVRDPPGREHPDCPPLSGFERGEPWMSVVGNRKKKR